MKTSVVFSSLVLSACVSLAASPQIDRFAPRGGRRGTEVNVVFSGQRLDDARGLLLYESGIAVKTLEVLPDKRVKAHLALASDCPLGPHALRMQTATGLSQLVTFSVGALPEIAAENRGVPNFQYGPRGALRRRAMAAVPSDISKPQKINLNTTVNGVILNEEVDYFAVEAKKGQRLSAEVEGLRLGETFFDPYLAIMDAKRVVLAAADDTPLLRQDCACSIIVPRDGTYVIQVRESAFGGSDHCHYRLHVGTFPRPLAVYPCGGKLGQTLDVTYIGDPSGPMRQKLTLPLETGTSPISRNGPKGASQKWVMSPFPFALWPQDAGGIAPSPNFFRLSPLDDVLEKEPNDDAAHATPFTAPAALNGVIDRAGDNDCWVFPAKKGQTFDVRVFARQLRTPLDSVIQVTRIGGRYIASNDDSGGPDSYVRFAAPADDRYLIRITDQIGRGGPDFVYRIEVTPVEPRLVIGLPERTQFVDALAPVPKGNRIALMLSAQREDFGGDVNLEMNGLPSGVAAQILPIPGDEGMVPVVLSASADAQLSSALVEITGMHKEGDRTIEGRLLQKTMLIRGINNREVLDYRSNRLAMAVTESVPFHIEIVPPKVPLVQNGVMELKVKAVRDKGFTSPITLHMLYNPPGVSSPDGTAIPEGQDEAAIPLTADGRASIRTSKIAVLGESYVGNGPVVVSTQLADLEVAEPVLQLQFQPAFVQQGQKTSVVVKIEKTQKLESPATVELLGLPNEVTTEARQIDDSASEVVFPIATTSRSPVGLHRTLVCRAVVKVHGEPITHVVPGGELRIQPPLPAKANMASQRPAKAASPASSKPAVARPLSRLEELRAEKKGVNQ